MDRKRQVNMYVAGLADTVDPVSCLVLHCGIPPARKVDDVVRGSDR